MVEVRVQELEGQVTDLRVSQGKVEVQLEQNYIAIVALTQQVKELTQALNSYQGERRGARAVLAIVGAFVGAILTAVIEWLSNHR